uniref:Uncharacterized protein n=1 Tax=Anguilla anguilla TaxID=7936 RepID=A0A0E9SSR0_ANGAN
MNCNTLITNKALTNNVNKRTNCKAITSYI